MLLTGNFITDVEGRLKRLVCGAALAGGMVLSFGLGNAAQAAPMEFSVTAIPSSVVPVVGPAPFSWDRMDGTLFGDPVPAAGSNVLDCFNSICEISSMTLDFSLGGATTAQFDFVLANPVTQAFTGTLNGLIPVEAEFFDFVYDIVSGECSNSTDNLCFNGLLTLSEAGTPFLELAWFGVGPDAPVSGLAAPLSFVQSDEFLCAADDLDDCGTFDVDVASNVPEPATIALFGLGLAGIGAATRRRRTR